jgi:hypothetical protein
MKIGYAVAAGVAAVIAAVAIFLLHSERRVIGTNTVAPLYGAVTLFPEKAACETIKRVPAGAGYLRLKVQLTETVVEEADPSASIRGIRVALSDPRGRSTSGVARGFEEGPVEVPLASETRGARSARLCVRSLDRRLLTLFGEQKRPFPGAPAEKRDERFAIAFLQPEPSSRLTRADATGKRYEFGHAGLVGGWALWAAGVLALAAAALALWLVARRLPRR